MEEVLFITVITAKLIGIYYSVSDWHGMDRWCRARAAVLAEDMDKLREMEMFREDGRDGVWTVMANVMDPESLRRAFDGCAGVFHTSAFVDPGGISGYTVSSTASLFFLLTSISRFFFPAKHSSSKSEPVAAHITLEKKKRRTRKLLQLRV